MKNKNKIILFDLDGTLIDSTFAILESFKAAFKKFSLPIPDDNSIKSHIGYPLDIIARNLGVSEAINDEFVLAYKEHYREIYLETTILLDGAKEAIEMAYEFSILGIVTTKTSLYSRLILENLGVAKFFDTIIGRDDVKNPKPSSEPILKG